MSIYYEASRCSDAVQQIKNFIFFPARLEIPWLHGPRTVNRTCDFNFIFGVATVAGKRIDSVTNCTNTYSGKLGRPTCTWQLLKMAENVTMPWMHCYCRCFFSRRTQVDAIQKRLLERVDGVLAVHEFHVWQLAGDRIIASAHIRCRNLSEYMRIAEKVKEFFHNEGIHSTTIQPEFLEIETLYNTTGKWEFCENSLIRRKADDFDIDFTLQLDGISTCLNVNGSQDGCAFDCPTTEEGCVKATCCQTNNKVMSDSQTLRKAKMFKKKIPAHINNLISLNAYLESTAIAISITVFMSATKLKCSSRKWHWNRCVHVVFVF